MGAAYCAHRHFGRPPQLSQLSEVLPGLWLRTNRRVPPSTGPGSGCSQLPGDQNIDPREREISDIAHLDTRRARASTALVSSGPGRRGFCERFLEDLLRPERRETFSVAVCRDVRSDVRFADYCWERVSQGSSGGRWASSGSAVQGDGGCNDTSEARRERRAHFGQVR